MGESRVYKYLLCHYKSGPKMRNVDYDLGRSGEQVVFVEKAPAMTKEEGTRTMVSNYLNWLRTKHPAAYKELRTVIGCTVTLADLY